MGLVLDCLAMSCLGKFLLSIIIIIIKIKIRHISLLGTIGLFLGPYSRWSKIIKGKGTYTFIKLTSNL
jgi:hypothetical protein